MDNSFRTSIAAALTVAVVATALAILGWNVFEFDRSLFIYAQALIVSLALTVYRFTIWLHRPPTWVLFQQSLDMLRRPDSVSRLAKHLGQRVISYFALNRFVWRRGLNRWAAHWPIMIGCLMALAIVVPLIFGWVWFETPAEDLHSYKVMLFGQHIRTIPVDGIEAFLAFHGLVWASFPVILGCGVALYRRLNDRGDQATQTWGNDLAPLVCLLAIAVSGLLMTVSYSFLGGMLHTPVAWFHCLIVCGTLIWLPYSKLFHIPQRSLKLAHMVYEHESETRGMAKCARCENVFAAVQQVEDLIRIENQLGYAYDISADANSTRRQVGPSEKHNRASKQHGADSVEQHNSSGQDGLTRLHVEHYQSICPKCRRAALVIAQGKRWRNSGEPNADGLSSQAPELVTNDQAEQPTG